MKKSILVVVVALFAAVTTLEAQKVNTESLLGAIEKSEKDLANPKKSAKASTWMDAAQKYAAAQIEPVKALYAGMDMSVLEITCGKSKSSTEVTLGGKSFTEVGYPYMKVYMQNGQVVAWTQTKQVQKGAMDKALEYYAKAYELEPAQGEKIKAGLKTIVDYYKQIGDASITLADYKTGADAFVKAYEICKLPVYDEVDPTLIYYAGYMYTILGSDDAKLYVKGEECLREALEADYQAVEDANTGMDDKERGDIYYYIYHSCIGQQKVQPAKEALLIGISSYPQNERIFEGLTQLYTAAEGGEDPAELIAVIDKNLEVNPNSVTTWFGRGRVYFALKNYDECIVSFEKVIELSPELFDGQFYLGLFYTMKGDNAAAEMDSKTYKSQSEYDADLADVNAIYAKSIPCYEAALALRPGDVATLDYLKAICFRLRDEPGMMDKYTKYNEMFKAASGN